ncbi:MAG: hypothetical protein WCC86_10130 [Methanoregula sp.]
MQKDRIRTLQKIGPICLIVLCIGCVITAGCTEAGGGTAPTTSVTPAASLPALASSRSLAASLSLDPIVGVWRSPGPAYLFTISFDVNGKTQETFANQPGVMYNGTWKPAGDNTYLVTRDSGANTIWVYSPESNTMFNRDATGITYSLYQGAAGASRASLSGTGNMVIPFSATRTGLWAFTLVYSGQSNYIVWLTDAAGNRVALLANDIDSCTVIKTQKLDEGKYYLNITASGPWTIQAVMS